MIKVTATNVSGQRAGRGVGDSRESFPMLHITNLLAPMNPGMIAKEGQPRQLKYAQVQ